MCLCVYMCMHMHEEALHLFFSFIYFYSMYMSFLTEYINAHHVCRRQFWELNRGSLEDQLVHLTAYSQSLQSFKQYTWATGM